VDNSIFYDFRVITLLGGFTPASPSPHFVRFRHPPKAKDTSNNASPFPADGRGNSKPSNQTLVLPTASLGAEPIIASYKSGLSRARGRCKKRTLRAFRYAPMLSLHSKTHLKAPKSIFERLFFDLNTIEWVCLK